MRPAVKGDSFWAKPPQWMNLDLETISESVDMVKILKNYEFQVHFILLKKQETVSHK
jgi:hypothetical protein